jgi:hypothetical protein
MINTTRDDIFSMLERWDRHEMTMLNRNTEANGDVRFLIGRCQIPMEAAAHAAREIRDPKMAMRLLQLTSFAVSSVERHLQRAGEAPGEGVMALRATPVLEQLGEIAGHAPRDSHYTYWLLNDGGTPLTFTGSTYEIALVRTMSSMHDLQSKAVAALRPICRGDLSMTSATAVEAMEYAAANLDQLTMRLHTLLAAPPEDRARSMMELEMLAMTLATYLCTYPVGMQTWTGPDPANMPAAMQLDLAIGPPCDGYEEMLRARMPQLMDDDRMALEMSMKQPSLAMRLLEAAELSESALMTMPDQMLAGYIRFRPCLRPALRAYTHLVNAAETSASYISVVQDHLRPARKTMDVTFDKMKTLVQRVDRYATMPQPKERRTTHPTVCRLLAAAG